MRRNAASDYRCDRKGRHQPDQTDPFRSRTCRHADSGALPQPIAARKRARRDRTRQHSRPRNRRAAMAGVTHVVHLATCKETPETVMDVTVKGMFWLLEASAPARHPAVHPDRRRCRRSAISSIGIRCPVTETTAAYGLSRLLRALQSAGRGDARHSMDPIWIERLLPARAVDHGEGRLPLPALVRRRCVRRAATGTTWSAPRKSRSRMRKTRHDPGDAGCRRASRCSATSSM